MRSRRDSARGAWSARGKAGGRDAAVMRLPAGGVRRLGRAQAVPARLAVRQACGWPKAGASPKRGEAHLQRPAVSPRARVHDDQAVERRLDAAQAREANLGAAARERPRGIGRLRLGLAGRRVATHPHFRRRRRAQRRSNSRRGLRLRAARRARQRRAERPAGHAVQTHPQPVRAAQRRARIQRRSPKAEPPECHAERHHRRRSARVWQAGPAC